MGLLRKWWPLIFFGETTSDLLWTAYLLASNDLSIERNPVVRDLLATGNILSIGGIAYVAVLKYLVIVILLGRILIARQRKVSEEAIARYGVTLTLAYFLMYAVGIIAVLIFE